MTKMPKILTTPEGKVVCINIDADIQLYTAPASQPRGTDIYAHTAKSGKTYFYAFHWSRQKEQNRCELMSEERVKEFLISKAQLCSCAGLSDEELQTIEQFFPGLFDETA